MSDQNIEILKKETYLKAIDNSVGTKLFSSLFVRYKDTGEIKDVLDNGEYSCAFFVSGLLSLLQIIDKPVATVESLKKMIQSNEKWKTVSVVDIENGDVIFWNKIKFDDGSENAHAGFVLNKDEAISTSYKTKSVVRHSSKDREIDCVYRYIW